MRVVFVRVPDDLHRLVRIAAASEGRTLQEVGIAALTEYVNTALNIEPEAEEVRLMRALGIDDRWSSVPDQEGEAQ